MATLNTAIADVPRVVWSALTTAGSPGATFTVRGQAALAGCVQVTGTFGGATITVQVSNDGTNWVTIKDLQGLDITFTAAGLREFATAAAYIRAISAGGTGDSVTVTMVLRGLSS